MGRIISEARLYGVFPNTGIEFLAADVGTEIDEDEYKRLLAYNKKRGTAVEAVVVAEPTKAELQARATTLGIEFKGGANKAVLSELIAAKEAETAAAEAAAAAAAAEVTKED
jgi:acetyl-CoA carboxylase beta subunit